MSARLVSRVLLVVVAGAAIAWYAHGLRALGLREDGEATLRTLRTPPDTTAVRSARSGFRRAAGFNADPAPELDEAVLLLRTGHARAAAGLIERVVRHNPGSVPALSLLAAATRTFDERRSTAVDARLLELYGRQEGLPVRRAAIPAPDGRLFGVDPARMTGSVDDVRVRGASVAVGGWAADVRRKRRVSVVLVVSHGRVVAAVAPLVNRPDIARGYGASLLRSGFFVRIPRSRLEQKGALDILVYAAEDGVATPLQFSCHPVKQDFGC